MPTDLGVNQASVERIVRALTDGVISTGKEVVMRHALAVLEREAPKAGMGYITDDAKRRIRAALSQ